jgi:DNA-binding NarL/FixJ family response regulator
MRVRQSSFLGRTDELALLERAIAEAASGMPSVVLIEGEAGIGKTTLIGEAARRTQALLLVARAVQVGDDPVPLAPLVDLVRQVRRIRPSLLDDARLASLSQLSRHPEMVSVGAGGLADAALDLVAALGSDDVAVVVFDDLQWADPLSWDLFELVARNLADERVILAATLRTSGTATHPEHRRRLAEIARLPVARRVELSGLERPDIARQVRELMGDVVAPEVIEDVAARGQGNPMFTEELIAAHRAGQPLSTILADLLTADIRTLDADTRHVASVVAAVGRSTPHDLVAAVVGGDIDRLEAALHAALDRQVLVLEPANESYRFRHPLIGEVVAAELLPSERRRLHLEIAAVLEARPELTVARAAPHAELAFHLHRGGDAAGAFEASLEATDELVAFAPSSALGHLERALELWDVVDAPSDERSRRLWQAAELAYSTGFGQRAVELASAAFRAGPPERGSAWGHERLGRYLWTAGRLAESAVEYERAAALVDPDGGDRSAAAVYSGLGQADLLFCRYESAEANCRRALAIIGAPDDGDQVWVDATRVLALVRSYLGYTEEAERLSRAALARAHGSGDRSLAATYLTEVLLHAARFGDAVAVALDEAAAGQRAGLDRSMGGYLSAMAAEGLLRLGCWTEATEVLARLEGIDAVPPTRFRLDLARAQLAARQGNAEIAAGLVCAAAAIPVDPLHEVQLHATAAEVHLLAGEFRAALGAGEVGWAHVCSGDRRLAARFAFLTAAAAIEDALDRRARREEVDVAEVAAELAERISAARAASTPPDGAAGRDADAHLMHAEAYVSMLTEPYPNAWSSVASRWDAIGDRWSASAARLHEAEAAVATGASARAAEALQSAYRIAAEVGARPLVRRAEDISRRSRISLEPTEVRQVDATEASSLGLTSREAEVLSRVTAGETNRQIGEALFVSEKTVSVHVSNILRKLGVSSRVEAAAVAQRLGMG